MPAVSTSSLQLPEPFGLRRPNKPRNSQNEENTLYKRTLTSTDHALYTSIQTKIDSMTVDFPTDASTGTSATSWRPTKIVSHRNYAINYNLKLAEMVVVFEASLLPGPKLETKESATTMSTAAQWVAGITSSAREMATRFISREAPAVADEKAMLVLFRQYVKGIRVRLD